MFLAVAFTQNANFGVSGSRITSFFGACVFGDDFSDKISSRARVIFSLSFYSFSLSLFALFCSLSFDSFFSLFFFLSLLLSFFLLLSLFSPFLSLVFSDFSLSLFLFFSLSLFNNVQFRVFNACSTMFNTSI